MDRPGNPRLGSWVRSSETIMPVDSRKIIVTGGAGFIGSHLVDRLLAEGASVVVIDNFDPYYSPALKSANLDNARGYSHDRFRLQELDIRDAAGVKAVIEREQPHAIIHMAAKAGVRPSIEAPTLYTEVNVLGTVHLLEAAVAVRPLPRFILASSSSVYGDRDRAPFRESDPVDSPVSPYAATKRAAELMTSTFHHLHGLPATCLRFFTAYGPRNRPDLAISKFARLIEQGETVPMFGDGTTRRDYTYVDDLVDGIVRATERCSGLNLYNLGHSHPIELRAMIEEIGRALGKTPKIQRLPDQPGDVRLTFADVSLAAAELGYHPRTTFEEGIRQFVQWSRA